MKLSHKMMLVAVPLALISFGLGRVIWPDPIGTVGPSSGQVPLFMFISLLESISFGVGMAFLIFGWSRARSMAQESNLSFLAFLAIVWAMISWWPHDNMHRVNPMGDYAGLLRIEYIFHFTLVLAGLILALFFWRLAKKQ